MKDDRHKLEAQNILNSKTFELIANTYNLPEKRVLDLGCGQGGYMQRFGKGSVGITTDVSEVEYGRCAEIDIRFGNVERLSETIQETESFDVFWANNLFEHLLSPHSFLVKLKPFAKPDSLLILGVPVIPKVEILAKFPKFRGAYATPHINFFTKKTLETTILRSGWNILDVRSFALRPKFVDRLSKHLMPHLYFIARNNSTYKYPPKKIRERKDDPECMKLLKIM